MNPFFNYVIAAINMDLEFTDVFGTTSTAPTGAWKEDALETLQRFPLDRVDWRHTNSHRLDIMKIHPANQGFDQRSFEGRGYRVNGKVIPVDECYFNHWNRNPWQLDTGGRGHGLGDGTTVFVDITENRNINEDNDGGERFSYEWTDDTPGWQFVQIPFTDMNRKPIFNEAPNDGWTGEEVHGWSFGTLGTDGSDLRYIDDFNSHFTIKIRRNFFHTNLTDLRRRK